MFGQNVSIEFIVPGSLDLAATSSLVSSADLQSPRSGPWAGSHSPVAASHCHRASPVTEDPEDPPAEGQGRMAISPVEGQGGWS